MVQGVDEVSARRLLGLSVEATTADIEAAFRALVMATHPDRGGDAEAFRSVVEARRALLRPSPTRRPAPVTVIPDENPLHQLIVAVLRKLLDRRGPNRTRRVV